MENAQIGIMSPLENLGKKNPSYTYSLNGNDLEVVDQEKDVGVIVHDSLKPSA